MVAENALQLTTNEALMNDDRREEVNLAELMATFCIRKFYLKL